MSALDVDGKTKDWTVIFDRLLWCVQGEVKWCRWLNRIYQEDCRKAALMRLRRIQDYVIKQRKVTALSWNSTGAVSSYSILATSSRGCHEDATRKLLPWN